MKGFRDFMADQLVFFVGLVCFWWAPKDVAGLDRRRRGPIKVRTRK